MNRIVRAAVFVADLRNALRISEENWGRGGRESVSRAMSYTSGSTPIVR